MFKKSIRILAVLLCAAGVSGAVESTPPLDLRAVCQLTRQHNPTLAGATAEAAQAAAMQRKAQAGLRPRLTARSSYSHISEPTLFGATPILESDTFINRIELTQPLYTGGQLQAAVKAADYGKNAVEQGRAAVEAQVLTQAAGAYFRALQAKAAVAVAESSVNSLTANYDDARKLFEAGVVINSDVLRAEVALASAKDQLISANNNYATAVAALKTAIGLPQETDIELSSAGQDLPDMAQLPAKTRAEVEATQFGVKAAEAQISAAQGASRPSLAVFVDYENQPKGAEFPRLSDSTMVGLQMQFTLFDGGHNRAEVAAAKAAAAKAASDLDGAKQQTEFQLEASRLALVSAQDRVKALATQVKSAEESYRVVSIGYQEGVNVLTDVLGVEAMLTQARSAHLNADYDLKIAKLNLLLALGQTQKLTE